MEKDGLILTKSEYDNLLEEIHRLRLRITELTALRDDLRYHVCPALKAEYDEKIVSLERELMAANMYLRQMQRTVEILQAQMNQQQEPSLDEAEARAKQENRQYEEDLHRKAEEARKFRKKWEESQWSKHDRQERETRGRNSPEGEERKEKENSTGSGGNESAGSQKEGAAGTGDKSAGKTLDQKEPEAGQSSPEEETTAQKSKRLYRKIVKRLHPDVHPNATEHEKNLLNCAMKAFAAGDLQQLERIWDELSGMDIPEDAFEDTPEGRKKLKELIDKLKARMMLLEQEIDRIKTEFPYKLKSFLEDPEAIEAARRGIQSKIDNVREMNRRLEAFINELKEKIRKGEKI